MMPLLFEAALRSTVLSVAIWLTLKALRVRDAHVEKLLWTVAVTVSLVMPVLMRAMALQLPAPASVVIPGSMASARVFGDVSHAAVSVTLLTVYWVVTGILLLRFLVRLHRASCLYRRARKSPAELLVGIDVRMSDEIPAPCTFATSILLPSAFGSWSPAARAAALAHERAHVTHRDCYRLWLATVYSCLFWFNPVSWLLRRRLMLLAELTSDREGLRCVEDSTAYATILVQLAAGARPLNAAVAMSGRAQLAERINRIMENNMNGHRLGIGRKVALATTSFVAAALCSSCVTGPHVLSPDEDSKVSWVGGAPLSQFYPAQLRKQGVEGYVVVKLAIDQAGRVTEAKVVKEHPARSGLARAALNAAHTFRFDNTLAEPVIKTMQFKFALSD
jgi:TonB family protein